MKKFICRSFITLSVLFAIHYQCGATTRSISIPDDIKTSITQISANDTTEAVIPLNDKIIDYLKSFNTKTERLQAFWEIYDFSCNNKEKLECEKKHINLHTRCNYDIYYCSSRHIIVATGKSNSACMLPCFISAHCKLTKDELLHENFYLVSNKGATTPNNISL